MTPEEQQKAINDIRRALEGRPSPVQVLLVEDDPGDAELTLAKLHKFGLQVDWVVNKSQLDHRLQNTHPWLIFLDLQLRQESGLDILVHLRERQANCKVVILTGAYQQDSEQCKAALREGAIAVMLKPLTCEQIQLIFGTP